MDVGTVIVDTDTVDTDIFAYNTQLTAVINKPNMVIRQLKTNPAKIPGNVINLNTVCQSIGRDKALGLIGVHAFTGGDWGGKFANISKANFIKTYLNWESPSPVFQAFQILGEEGADPLVYLDAFEEFTCKAYSKTTNCKKVSDLRWELFRDKNKEGENIPPTTDTLIPHIQRSHIISMIAKGYNSSHPEIPPLDGNGWHETSEGLKPVTCLSKPAPQEVLLLAKCTCKTPCSEDNGCGCVLNGLPCSGLCKCSKSDCECPNMSTRYGADSDSDGD